MDPSSVSHGAVPSGNPRWTAALSSWRGVGLVGLIFLWLGATAWMRPLHLPDEARYVGVAWEMLRSGDWLTPTLNGLPFFHKPPLFYWLSATALSIFGLTEWASRLVPLAAATATATTLFAFVRRWIDERTARYTLGLLLVQPLFCLGGQFANLDMLVAACISITIMLLAQAALQFERGAPYKPVLAAAYAVAALGVLAKGLIGLVLPALVVGCWLILRRRWASLWALFWLPGAALFAAIAAPWSIAMQLRFPAFLSYFFVVQQFERYSATGFNNVQPFWFYEIVLLGVSLPVLPWLIGGLRAGYFSDRHCGATRQLMWLWLVLVTVFFSMPASKTLGYILPAVPPLVFLIADGFCSAAATPAWKSWVWRGSVALYALVSIGIVLNFARHPHASAREPAAIIAQQPAPQNLIFMVGQFDYDVPFYAQLRQPVQVVYDWSDPQVHQLDTWRKELVDAGTFAPEIAKQVLVTPSDFMQQLCRSASIWILGDTHSVERFPVLRSVPSLYADADHVLWRWAQPPRGSDRLAECPAP